MQLMVVGPSLVPGHDVQQDVAGGSKLGLEHALSQLLLTVELIALVMIQKYKIAIRRAVQVKWWP